MPDPEQAPLRVLFVDDESSILSGLRRAMRQYRKEWDMTFALGAIEALKHIRRNPVDLIVSDVRMPQIQGSLMLTETAKEYPRIIRFVLSGQADKESVLSLVGSAHQYFSKPCQPDKLYESVSRILATRQQLNEDLVEFIHGLGAVPCSPEIYDQLGKLFAGETVCFDQVKELVSADVGLSTKVLQLVSSSFFGTPLGCGRVDAACDAIGLDLLKDLHAKSTAFVPLSESVAERIEEVNLTRLQACGSRIGQLYAAQSEAVLEDADSNWKTTEKLDASHWEAAAVYLLALWGIPCADQLELSGTDGQEGKPTLPPTGDAFCNQRSVLGEGVQQ